MPKLLIILLLCLSGCNALPAWAFTDEELARAIWFAEGGKKAKYPYGIRSINTFGNKDVARKICLTTIRNNRIRFKKQTKYTDFVAFLDSRYCPTKGKLSKAEQRLNGNWKRNVLYYLKKGAKK